MVYLNNAATTYPKPQSVLDAQIAAWQFPPDNPFRSSSFNNGKDVFTTCRENLGLLLGISETERIFFTSGATESLNRLFCGLELSGMPVVTTQTEHNSVLRPLFNHPDIKKNLHIVPCNGLGKVLPDNIERQLKELTPTYTTEYAGLLVVNHCSNVTGTLQDAKTIREIAHNHHFLFMLDVSQSAGCLPVQADLWNVDLLAFTGHKSLFGPQGTGGYFVRKGIPFKPVTFGGTGRDSSRLTYEDGDYEFEVGTQNAAGIAGLNAGVCYILNKGIEQIQAEEHKKMVRLYHTLSSFSQLILYGTEDENQGPLLSFNIKGMKPYDVGYILQNAYGITLRTGLHCSPLIHKALHTETTGTLRVSISDLTTDKDIDDFIQAIKEITLSLE